MKKLVSLSILSLALASLCACNGNEKKIVVGASPTPHAQILESQAVQDFVKSKGYTLEVKVYEDYVTPNKALNDYGIDANYFQHVPYLTKELEKGYKISAACQVHNEPLNLYGVAKDDYSNLKIHIIDDASNVERAFKLLVANGLLDSYSVENFDSQAPVYTSSKGVTIQCIAPGLLHNKVDEGGYAVIPGNYALTAWGSTKASSLKCFGETTEVAYPNIIAVRTDDLKSEKTDILVEALSKCEDFIKESYGPTVSFCWQDLRA